MTMYDNLEHELAELTRWRQPSPDLWRSAPMVSPAGGSSGGPRRLQAKRRAILGIAAAAALLFTIGVGLVLPAMNSPLSEVRSPAAQSTGAPSAWPMALAGRQTPTQFANPSTSGEPDQLVTVSRAVADALLAPSEAVIDRHVVRRATLELIANDVRAVFFRASHMMRDELGEYLEDSSITGAGRESQATLTLRVDVRRMSDVLNEIRALATVYSERVEGQDVTTQVVDLEARQRNEQRVETELLQLLEKRIDAPLKEILELRQSISTVRAEIEQLTAQRERLSRQVSLATILVIIRASDAPVEPPSRTYEHFVSSLRTAWRKGLTDLVDAIALLVAMVVGGLVWWIAAAVIALIVFRRMRSKTASANALPPTGRP